MGNIRYFCLFSGFMGGLGLGGGALLVSMNRVLGYSSM